MQLVPQSDYDEICKRYLNNESYQSIADTYGVSRERIRQILKKFNIDKKDSGRLKKIAERAAERKKEFDGAINERSGIPNGDLKEIKKADREMYDLYISYVNNAVRRKIDWNINLREFSDFIKKSGKRNKLGRGKRRYMLARKDFSKGYSIDNVHLVKFDEGPRLYQKQKNAK